MQERLVQERLQLLTHLSTFLPPPLANLLSPFVSNTAQSILPQLQQHKYPSGGLQFWNTHASSGRGETERWWSIEELGEGASVVRSRVGGDGSEREVWVLRMGDGEVNNGVSGNCCSFFES
jgi:hypothetical protein